MAVLALALASASGCSSDGDVDTERPAADVSATPTPTATAPSEEAAILAAYSEFFARQTEISTAPKEERRVLLEPFTTDPALERVLRGMFAAEEFGEVGYGTPVLDPRVKSIDGNEATVVDCQDTTDFGRKKRSNDKVTTRGTTGVKAETQLKRGDDGTWRISFVDYPEGSC